VPAQQQHWIRSAYLSGATGPVVAGYALVSNGTRYVVATSANRASYGRAEGVAITSGDNDDTQIEIQSAGTIPNSITGLGAGTATWVIVGATGALERDASPDSGDDVIGKCNARGDLFVAPGVWDETNTIGGSAYTAPTGTGFARITSGSQDAAASAVNLAGGATHVTGTLPIGNGGTGATSFTADQVVVGHATALTTATNVKAGSGYVSIGATPATTGGLRLANNTFVYSRDSADGSNVPLIGLSASDVIQIGNLSGFPIEINPGLSDPVTIIGQEVFLDGNAIQLFGTDSDFGGGVGVLAIDEAATNPTTNPTAGIVLYVDSLDNTLKYRQADGTVVVLDGGGSVAVGDITGLGANVATFLATPSSANLRSALTDETGTGAAVFANTPTLVTPVLGAATATSVDTSSYVSVGAGTKHATALIRLPYVASDVVIGAPNNGGTDYPVLHRIGANSWRFGDATGWNTSVYGDVVTFYGASGTTMYAPGGSVVAIEFAASANIGLFDGAGFGSGSKVLSIANATTAPTGNPTGGGILYAEAGAGKWRGSGGTITTFGPADPHCPTCGRDFATEHRNDDMGEHLAVCLPCLIDTLKEAGIDTKKFAMVDKRKATKAQWDENHARAKAAGNGRP
jgi:hypothetical protein